ncbi:unnamed protein product [Allacma fusca]|uniref:Uncharacterized protein n=1 Tax=Allacma fusca TaxID=39272 RepID=A0A8J2L0Y0_9HEXA|nr:unnamed protein product [Allacma fusca]
MPRFRLRQRNVVLSERDVRLKNYRRYNTFVWVREPTRPRLFDGETHFFSSSAPVTTEDAEGRSPSPVFQNSATPPNTPTVRSLQGDVCYRHVPTPVDPLTQTKASKSKMRGSFERLFFPSTFNPYVSPSKSPERPKPPEKSKKSGIQFCRSSPMVLPE